jgi:hypothetical protein
MNSKSITKQKEDEIIDDLDFLVSSWIFTKKYKDNIKDILEYVEKHKDELFYLTNEEKEELLKFI